MQWLRDLWGVLEPGQRRWVLLAQLLSLMMACSTVAGVASIAPFFAAVGDAQATQHAGVLHDLHRLFGFPERRTFQLELGALFIATILLANVINVLGSLVLVRLAYRISTDLQAVLFSEYLHRPYAYHLDTHSAGLFNNVVHESARVINDVMQNLLLLVTQLVTALLIVAAVIWVRPVVALGLIAALAGGYTLLYLLLRNGLLHAGQRQSSLLVDQTRTVQDSIGAIKELLVLHAQRLFEDRFARVSRELGRLQANTLLVAQSPRYIMECVAAVALTLSALLGASLGQLTFLALAAYRLLPSLQQSFASIVRIRAERARFAAIAPDLRQARARRVETLLAWGRHPEHEIRLRDVTYRYQSNRPVVLAGVSLTIAARTVVGLVGTNGSGKTTLVDVIAGLLAPTIGRLEVDGIGIDDATRGSWQRCIAYVPQQVFLADASLACNIAFGVDEADIDRNRLFEAGRLAQLDSLVQTLPGGYDHCIGERGVRLSGGQRQRIGIARALYTGAPVIILDEATHALDGLTEQEIMATMLQLRGRYTLLLIAHRLDALRACDHIFELEQGRIRAQGSYADLMRDSETFRRLASLS
jgi:ATP-binding cassette, subfamily B, bacterial PglK